MAILNVGAYNLGCVVTPPPSPIETVGHGALKEKEMNNGSAQKSSKNGILPCMSYIFFPVLS